MAVQTIDLGPVSPLTIIDLYPTKGSKNPVASGGVEEKLENGIAYLEVTPRGGGSNIRFARMGRVVTMTYYQQYGTGTTGGVSITNGEYIVTSATWLDKNAKLFGPVDTAVLTGNGIAVVDGTRKYVTFHASFYILSSGVGTLRLFGFNSVGLASEGDVSMLMRICITGSWIGQEITE